MFLLARRNSTRISWSAENSDIRRHIELACSSPCACLLSRQVVTTHAQLADVPPQIRVITNDQRTKPLSQDGTFQ